MRYDAYMSEAQLQEHILKLCDGLSLAVNHFPDSRRSWLPGWPDLWIAGPGGVLYRELKDMRNSLSPEQRRVGSIISHSGGDWAVWRPRDLLDGTIQRQLAAIQRPVALEDHAGVLKEIA